MAPHRNHPEPMSDSDSDFDVPPLQSSTHNHRGRGRQGEGGPRDSLAVGLADPGKEQEVVDAWRKVRWSIDDAIKEPSAENVGVWTNLETFIKTYQNSFSDDPERRDEFIQWLGPDGIQKSFNERIELLDQMVGFYDEGHARWSLRRLGNTLKTEKAVNARKAKAVKDREEGKKVFAEHLREVQKIVTMLQEKSQHGQTTSS